MRCLGVSQDRGKSRWPGCGRAWHRLQGWRPSLAGFHPFLSAVKPVEGGPVELIPPGTPARPGAPVLCLSFMPGWAPCRSPRCETGAPVLGGEGFRGGVRTANSPEWENTTPCPFICGTNSQNGIWTCQCGISPRQRDGTLSVLVWGAFGGCCGGPVIDRLAAARFVASRFTEHFCRWSVGPPEMFA